MTAAGLAAVIVDSKNGDDAIVGQKMKIASRDDQKFAAAAANFSESVDSHGRDDSGGCRPANGSGWRKLVYRQRRGNDDSKRRDTSSPSSLALRSSSSRLGGPLAKEREELLMEMLAATQSANLQSNERISEPSSNRSRASVNSGESVRTAAYKLAEIRSRAQFVDHAKSVAASLMSVNPYDTARTKLQQCVDQAMFKVGIDDNPRALRCRDMVETGVAMGLVVGGVFGSASGIYGAATRAQRWRHVPSATAVGAVSFAFFLGCGMLVRC